MYLNITLLHIGDDMTMFNYNMGCIWILLFEAPDENLQCLTITWDVFELGPQGVKLHLRVRLTITWDVFEYAQPYKMETRDGV